MALIVDMEKRLGAFRLRVAFRTDGGVLALLGASGCGKSMTLKCIAGIENPFSCTVMLRRDDRPGAACLGWETDKAQWQAHRAELLRICLPPQELLLLKG